MGRILFNIVAGDWQDVVLALFNCRFFSDGCMHLQQVQYMTPASQHKETIKALYFRRDLGQLEVLHVTHAGDQLLRLFAERIEFPFWVILELLNQSFYDVLAISVF